MALMARMADKAGVVGSIVSAASCPACFPAIASLGAAAGLGFLSEYEGVFITRLLPLFAGLALLANALGWLSHRQWWRSAFGMAGPALVLAASVFFLGNWWTADLLYMGIGAMVVVSVWDLVAPAHRRCTANACAGPDKTMLTSTLTCPHCGFAKQETMPTDACQYFYECTQCKTILRPRPGDCCVYCSFGSVKCPPQQQGCCR